MSSLAGLWKNARVLSLKDLLHTGYQGEINIAAGRQGGGRKTINDNES
jgi:hypothetical protein